VESVGGFFESIKNDSLKSRNLNGFSAARIPAAQFIVQADAIIARFGKSGPILLISARRNGVLFGAPAPLDGIFHGSPAFRTVNGGWHDLIFFIKQVSFVHAVYYMLH
jgi:hypothetical protein